jgi:hypothetical protein
MDLLPYRDRIVSTALTVMERDESIGAKLIAKVISEVERSQQGIREHCGKASAGCFDDKQFAYAL